MLKEKKLKAILNEDVIVRISGEHGDIEVGDFPLGKQGVRIDRLRFDGKKLVDLADLNSIWVRAVGRSFELHAVEVPGSKKVAMSWIDRKRLVMGGDRIRLKTEAEVRLETKNHELRMAKNRLRSKFKANIGDPEDRIADLFKLVYLLIQYVKTNDPDVGGLLNDLLIDVTNTYPLEKIEASLKSSVSETDQLMQEYYSEVSKIKSPDDS